MTIAIHQPNYLPWLGYFYKLYACDVFVFHDAVPFSKASYTKRSRIRRAKHASDAIWLSLPLQRSETGTWIRDILIAGGDKWARAHFRKIENTYGGAPHFRRYGQWLRDQLLHAAQMPTLPECNIALIGALAGRLNIHPILRRSSEMDCHSVGSALNLEIVRACGGSSYLAGSGSMHYEDDVAFATQGISLVRHDLHGWLKEHPYDQGIPEFANGLSVIDALMHIGEEGVRDLFERYHRQTSAHAG